MISEIIRIQVFSRARKLPGQFQRNFLDFRVIVRSVHSIDRRSCSDDDSFKEGEKVCKINTIWKINECNFSKKKSPGFNPYYIHLPIDKHPISGWENLLIQNLIINIPFFRYDIPYTKNLRDMYDARMRKSDASSGVYSLSTQITPMTSGSNIGKTIDFLSFISSSLPQRLSYFFYNL